MKTEESKNEVTALATTYRETDRSAIMANKATKTDAQVASYGDDLIERAKTALGYLGKLQDAIQFATAMAGIALFEVMGASPAVLEYLKISKEDQKSGAKIAAAFAKKLGCAESPDSLENLAKIGALCYASVLNKQCKNLDEAARIFNTKDLARITSGISSSYRIDKANGKPVKRDGEPKNAQIVKAVRAGDKDVLLALKSKTKTLQSGLKKGLKPTAIVEQMTKVDRKPQDPMQRLESELERLIPALAAKCAAANDSKAYAATVLAKLQHAQDTFTSLIKA